jgi:MYXO-CTERM domain-containing protein
MRLRTKALMAASLLGVAGGVASASTSILSFNITNNTSQAWDSLLFEIRAPLASPFNPAALALVLFDTQSAAAHSTTNVNTTVEVPESGGAKQVRFSFNELGRVQPGQTYSYTVTVNNPEDSAFRIVRIATPVPTPGTAALAGVAGLVAVRRRRSA